jgi:FAD:protein FMN transferase
VRPISRRAWLGTGLASLGALIGLEPRTLAGSARPGLPGDFSCHYDHVLGTSLDVWTSAEHTRAAESAIEIDRLGHIFSPVDPESELSRLNAAAAPVPISAELLWVLRAYEGWQQRTAGACSPETGALTRLWREAERQGRLPNAGALAGASAYDGRPAWRIEERHGVAMCLARRPLDLNSIAKGFIIEQAANAVRARLGGIFSLLLNLGGDMTMWAKPPCVDARWRLGVQDPFRPEENATPLTTIMVGAGAVATSGGYQRSYAIGGRRYSHLLDPRTGFPAEAVAAATVIAPTSTTANVLATTLCILDPGDGLRLVEDTPGASCLIVTSAGAVLSSPGFANWEIPAEKPAVVDTDNPPAKAAADAWPDGFQVNVQLELLKPSGGKIKRPYVAIWAEDSSGKTVRTIAVWGNKPRWIPELSVWWKAARANDAMVKTVTRATRSPGKYDIAWDGKDDQGAPLPKGTYTIRVEVHREHGRHVTQVGKLECRAESVELTLDKNAEAEATVIKYGKKP